MKELQMHIKSKEKSYPIFINNDELSNLKSKIIEACNNKNYIVVFSQKVYKLYSKVLDFPKNKIFVLKDGEKEKNYKNYLKIIKQAIERGLTRNDVMIAKNCL